MRVGTTDHPPLLEPVLVYRSQQTLESEKVKTVEDVVDDALEAVGVVGVGNVVLLVGAADGETVGNLWFVVVVDATDTRGVAIVGEILEVLVQCRHSCLCQVLYNTGFGEGVEVPT